eukprot:12974428-Alexandrium_andersonii.AAC.1
MSASLVGSGDVYKRQSLASELFRAVVAFNVWNIRLNTALGCNQAAPVSYTHLTLPTICSV